MIIMIIPTKHFYNHDHHDLARKSPVAVNHKTPQGRRPSWPLFSRGTSTSISWKLSWQWQWWLWLVGCCFPEASCSVEGVCDQYHNNENGHDHNKESSYFAPMTMKTMMMMMMMMKTMMMMMISLLRRLLSDTALATHLQRNLWIDCVTKQPISIIQGTEKPKKRSGQVPWPSCELGNLKRKDPFNLTFSHLVSPTNFPGVFSTYLQSLLLSFIHWPPGKDSSITDVVF